MSLKRDEYSLLLLFTRTRVCVKWPITQGDKNIKYRIVTSLSTIIVHISPFPDQSVININDRVYVYDTYMINNKVMSTGKREIFISKV